jgi:superfamily II DNA helicase RecQ
VSQAAKRSRQHEQGTAPELLPSAMSTNAAGSHLPEPMVVVSAAAAEAAATTATAAGPAMTAASGTQAAGERSDAQPAPEDPPAILVARAAEAIKAASTIQIDPCHLVDTVVGLRYGRNPLYLSEQQRKLVHAVARGLPTIAVMPTGSGKTLAASSYMMAAMAKGTHEYVVYHVPFVSLQQDLYERFTDDVRGKAGLVAIFKPEHIDELVGMASTLRMLIVSSESVKSPTFGILMQAMRNQAREVTRIFVDEAHMLLMSSIYRESFKDIGLKLRGLGSATIVCMTATARPEELQALRKHVYVGATQVEIVQAPCHRVNLECRVQYAPENATDQQAMQAFADLVDEVLKNPLWKDSQMIIYARETARCSALKDVLDQRLAGRGVQVGVYHGKLLSQERESILKDFKQQKLHVMIATNALGVGVDILTVGVVLHYGIPGCSIHEFLQQIGRAARPGNKLKHNRGLSIVYSVVRERDALLRVVGVGGTPDALLAQGHGVMTPRQNAEAILEYVELVPGNACRRVFQAEALKERDTAKLSCKEIAKSGSTIDAARCDLCTTGNEGHNAAAAAQLGALAAQTAATSFEAQLKQAEMILNPDICCLCSLHVGMPVKYGYRPHCKHTDATHWSRCFVCGAPPQVEGKVHHGKDCDLLKIAFCTDSKPTPFSRCLKCHRLMSVCDSKKCGRKERTILLAMSALRMLRPTARWLSFRSKLPQALQLLVDGEGDFEQWKASTKELALALLRQPAGLGEQETSDYLAVHAVLVFASQTIKR